MTQLGVHHFGADGEMELAGLQPGVAEASVDAATGWRMRRATTVAALPLPTSATLAAIRSFVT